MSSNNPSISRAARLALLMCATLFAGLTSTLAQIENLTADDAIANPQGFSGEFYTGRIQTAFGPRDVSYQVLPAAEHDLEEDLAIFDGDIVLTSIDSVKTVPKPGVKQSAGRSNTSFRWSNGVVPYEIDSLYSSAEQQQINAAINHWNAVTPYWLRPRNGETDYVRFARNTSGLCASPVGRQGNRQSIFLDMETAVTAVACGTGNAIHEIGHSIGLWHEQSRADRDNFVIINFANIQACQSSNFQTYVQSGADGQDMFDFDFNSIMLYGSFAFARRDIAGNLLPTITRLDGTTFTVNRTGLSPTDIAGAVRILTRDASWSGDLFKIVNVYSGKCLDVANWSRGNNAPVNQFDCHGGDNQRWYFWNVPGTNSRLIINYWSGHCLDIPGWSTNNNALLQQFSCHGYANQQFQSQWPIPSNGSYLQNVNSGKCLDVPNWSTSSGVRIQQFSCHFGGNQQWMAVP